MVLSDAQLEALTGLRFGAPDSRPVMMSNPASQTLLFGGGRREGRSWERRRPGFDEGAFAWLFDHACHHLQTAIFHQYRPGGAPPARRVWLDVDLGPSQQLLVNVEVYDGHRVQFAIHLPQALHPEILSQLRFEQLCELWWNGAAEQFNREPLRRFDWRDHVELRSRVQRAYRGLPPLPSVLEFEAPLGPGEALPETTYTVQVDTPPERGLTIENFRRAAELLRGMDLAREDERMAMMPYGVMRGLATLDGIDAATGRVQLSPARLEEVRRANEARDAAVKRGEALLKSWLTPEQHDSYERRSCFEVRGGATGRRYRIERAASYNVAVLDGRGEAVNRLCFMPEGGLVGGDIMLAQKLALETDEEAALKVANMRGGVDHWGPGYIAPALTWNGDWIA